MESWPSGIGCLEYPVLDSTNAEGKRLAFRSNGDTWIFAHKQTDGKGSRGRTWLADDHNFTASFLYYPSGTLKQLAHRSFVTSLALFDSFVFAGVEPNRLNLKWPNDVLLDSKKVSGILLETSPDSYSKNVALIIGIGINLFSYPDLNQRQTISQIPTCLKSVLFDNTPNALTMLTYLANSLQNWEKKYNHKGFSYVKEAWLALTYSLGSKVDVHIRGKRQKGSFQGITDDGSLILRIDNSLTELSVADVFFMEP